MQPKLLKTTVAEYKPAVYSGENECGWCPIGDRVLILPDEAADKTSGGVFIDPRTIERGSMAAETGVVVENGDAAFLWNSDRTRPFAGYKPQPGDRVAFERYAGQLLLGVDGRLYRVMDDRCVGSVKAK